MEDKNMGYLCDYYEVVEKLKSGERLSERELATLVCDGAVDEIDGDSGRWTKHVQTIINIDGDLWAIDWRRGLTEYQENEFYNQPYRVIKQERHVIVTEYVATEG
jgi:hypothetical protein